MCIRQKQNHCYSPVLKIVPVVAHRSLPMVGKESFELDSSDWGKVAFKHVHTSSDSTSIFSSSDMASVMFRVNKTVNSANLVARVLCFGARVSTYMPGSQSASENKAT